MNSWPSLPAPLWQKWGLHSSSACAAYGGRKLDLFRRNLCWLGIVWGDGCRQVSTLSARLGNPFCTLFSHLRPELGVILPRRYKLDPISFIVSKLCLIFLKNYFHLCLFALQLHRQLNWKLSPVWERELIQWSSVFDAFLSRFVDICAMLRRKNI